MVLQQATEDKLDVLFPVPSPAAPSPQAPGRLPGVTPESTAALRRTLKENHTKWHIFFNDKRFHNHTSHQLLAIYPLGATPALLDAAYRAHASYMRPAVEPPGPVSAETFHAHLGDENFYAAYLEFFAEALLEQGAAATLERYVFSPAANDEPPTSAPGAAPMRMLARFHSGLLHPLIHAGYGAEFGLFGMLAEGLAQTAVHHADVPVLPPPSIQDADTLLTGAGEALASQLARAALGGGRREDADADAKPRTHVHPLALVARLLDDDAYSYTTLGLPPPADDPDDSGLARVLRLRGAALAAVVEEWVVDGADAGAVAARIDELFWTTAVLFGVGGWGARARSRSGRFKGDFFLVHLVTSALFLPSLAALLAPASIAALLRSYLLSALTIYVARGRPALPIAEFMSPAGPTPTPSPAPAPPPPRARSPPSATADPDPSPAPSAPAPAPGPTSPLRPPTCAPGTLVPAEPTPNPWLALLQSTLAHPDDHLCKLQRALAHFAARFGAAAATTPGACGACGACGGCGLPGAEKLDGTFFVRVAGLAMDRLGWVREGEAAGEWDFDGFYHD